jgi:xanthine dehydrogenase small subunit
MEPDAIRTERTVPISFLLNGAPVEEASAPPTATLLDWLRETRRLTGTKEGCAEGDCGACTVLLQRDGRPAEAVNACIALLGQVDGAAVTTVEGLADGTGTQTAVQAAMAEADASQCGFCTPGIVMALEALRRTGGTTDDATIHETLAGNLCRCTGYRPIVDAARRACPPATASADPPSLPASGACHQAAGDVFYAPATLAELVVLRAANPDARLLAGATDLGLLASRLRQRIPVVISTRRVVEMRAIADTGTAVRIGAAVTYAEALPEIEALYPSFGALIRRIGSRQIRAMGTLGGNIGNASPIGDTPPCLIAPDATLHLAGPRGERTVPLEAFFLDYRRTDLAADEVIVAISVPKLRPGEIFRAYKISRRHDQDISAVVGAWRLTLADGVVRDARIAFGGMAATPKRAAACEAALIGRPWTEATAREAAAAVAADFTPIDDHRASAAYRLRVAGNLFVRLWHETAGSAGELLEVMAL